jgi:hypothetical protein
VTVLVPPPSLTDSLPAIVAPFSFAYVSFWPAVLNEKAPSIVTASSVAVC